MSHPDNDKVFEPLEVPGFTFACHPEVPCFTRCCQDLKLHLTPYDILRLTRSLDLSSQEFIDMFCSQEQDNSGFPHLYLKMRADDTKCPFLTISGCRVYEHRPAACRLYPLGRASRRDPTRPGSTAERFFLVKEDHCQGFAQERYWTIEEWITNQEADLDNEINDLWLPVITRKIPVRSEEEREKKLKMFFLACYQLDEFYSFITKSRFLEKFVIEPVRLDLIQKEPVELLKLSMDWLKFSLFGEPTLTVRQTKR